MSFIDLVQVSIVSDSNPSDFLSSLVYMTYKSGDFFIRGIEITIALATFGTVIAFFLALLFVFLRIQTFDRVDNDLTRFFKSIGRGFATIYSTIVRGTPMMVQGLLIYYAGFTVLRGMGFETAQANQIWSTFTAGLVTISLNSTAYMMEVLRGGIESIDPGQAEAARSLGLSQWQAMRKVVFPRALKTRFRRSPTSSSSTSRIRRCSRSSACSTLCTPPPPSPACTTARWRSTAWRSWST